MHYETILKTSKIIGVLATIILLVILNLFLSPVDKNKYSHIPKRDLPQKEYVGHARFLSDSLKNNSIALYDYLVKKGIKVIETDIIFSKDNVPILSHDNELFPNFKIKENIACDRNGKLLNTWGGWQHYSI